MSAQGDGSSRTVRSWSYQPVSTNVDRLYLICFVGIGGAFALGLLAITQAVVAGRGGDPEAWGFVLARIALWTLALAPLAILIGLAVRGVRRDAVTAAEFEELIASLGLERISDNTTPDYPGALFQGAFPSWAFSRLARDEPRFLEIGNLAQRVPAGRATTTETWGYAALQLPRRLPHILLEAATMGQRTSGALPVSVDPEQRVSLEGDFDRHFTLYCPRGYEVDALSLLAPDVMALLIDEVGGWSVEIIDDWLFIYSADDFVRGARPDTYERLLRAAELIGDKADRRAATYRDDRVDPVRPAVQFADGRAIAAPDGSVAPEGREMAPGTPQYTRLFRRSLWVLGIMCVLFVVGAFVAIGIVQLAYP